MNFKTKDKLVNYVTMGELDKALDALLEIYPCPNKIREAVIAKKLKYETLEDNNNIGVLTTEEYNVGKLRLSKSILELIRKLSKRSSKELLNIRENLIQKYQKRLTQKRDSKIDITPILHYDKNKLNIKKYLKRPKDSLEKDSLISILRNHKHVLLLGEEEIGKTILILKLALQWLQSSINLHLPIILDLSLWEVGKVEFLDWLNDTLRQEYHFSKSQIKQFVSQKSLLLLFDSLDCLDQDERKLSLEKINNYILQNEVEYFLMCSREMEYTEIDIDIIVQVCYIASKDTKLKYEKKESSINIKNKNALIQTNSLSKRIPALKDIFGKPFYRDIAQKIFDNPNEEEDNYVELQNSSDLKTTLIEKFIDKKFKETKNPLGFDKKQTSAYLAWLTSILCKNNKLNSFELATFDDSQVVNALQLRFILNWINIFFNYLLSLLVFGIIIKWGGLVVTYEIEYSFEYTSLEEILDSFINIIKYLLHQPFNNIFFTFTIGAIIASFYAIFSITIGNFFKYDSFKLTTKPNGVYKVDFKKIFYLSLWTDILLHCTLYGILYAISGFIVGGIFYSLPLAVNWGITGLLLGGLIGFSKSIFDKLILRSNYTQIDKPYKRYISELIYNFLFTLVITYLLTLTIAFFYDKLFLFKNLRHWLINSIFISFLLSIINTTFLNHLIVHFCLYIEDKIPLRLVRFLRFAEKLKILKYESGKWSFRSKELQDHFFELSNNNINQRKDNLVDKSITYIL